MKTKRIASEGTKTYVLVFDKDDEVASHLLQFARDEGITAAFFNALGAFEDVTFGWFDREIEDYKRIELTEGMEVMSFVGNLGIGEQGEPKLHAHVMLGKRDGVLLQKRRRRCFGHVSSRKWARPRFRSSRWTTRSI